MRLVNADARVTVNSFDPMNDEYYHDKMSVEQALDEPIFGMGKALPERYTIRS